MSNKNNETTEKKPRNLKKFKYGSVSAAVVILVIAIVVIINIIAGALMKRYPISVDLTADNRYELCDETIDVLKNLDEKVEIVVMYPEATLLQYNYYNMIPKILDNYKVYAEAGNGEVEVTYVDVTKDPDVVSKYSKYYNGTISEGSIVVYANEKVKVTSIYNLFAQNSSNSYYQTDASVTFMGESTITSAIMSVTDANPINAAFASFNNSAYVYGENVSVYYPAEQLKSLLSTNGYECTDIDVMTDDISPEDYDLVVIPAPANDFNDDIITKLEDFLYNDGNYGKHMVYLAGLNSINLPNITEFLAKWDLQIEENVVLDEKNVINASLSTSSQIIPSAVVSITDTEAVGELPNESLPIIAPFAREVSVLEKNGDYVAGGILSSASTSYLTPLTEDAAVSEDEASRVIAAISKRERAEGFDVYTSSILAIGSIYMTDPAIITNTSAYNNANFLLNTLNTMTGKESSFVIPQKNLHEEALTLTASQAKGISAVVIYVIPLIVVAAGIVVFVRRRNR